VCDGSSTRGALKPPGLIEDNGALDQGTYVPIKLGRLASRQRVDFTSWYGVARIEATAITALERVRADFWSLAQAQKDGIPTTYLYSRSQLRMGHPRD
jgi:hypothetical protein